MDYKINLIFINISNWLDKYIIFLLTVTGVLKGKFCYFWSRVIYFVLFFIICNLSSLSSILLLYNYKKLNIQTSVKIASIIKWFCFQILINFELILFCKNPQYYRFKILIRIMWTKELFNNEWRIHLWQSTWWNLNLFIYINFLKKFK